MVILVALALAAAPGPTTRAQQAATVYIAPLPYLNSVPHEMLLGHSYRLVVVLVSNGRSTQSGSVVMSFPQGFYFTDHAVSSFRLLPGDTEVLNFTIVATNTTSSPTSVSAVLVVDQGLQQVALQRVTATVDSIGRDPAVYLLASGGLGVALLAVLIAAMVLRRRGARLEGPIDRRPTETNSARFMNTIFHLMC